jgi:hypothetical protein
MVRTLAGVRNHVGSLGIELFGEPVRWSQFD